MHVVSCLEVDADGGPPYLPNWALLTNRPQGNEISTYESATSDACHQPALSCLVSLSRLEYVHVTVDLSVQEAIQRQLGNTGTDELFAHAESPRYR